MTEGQVKVFVEGTLNFFARLANARPSVGVPYPMAPDFHLLEYTGAIGISGAQKGFVYVTANRPMLEELLTRITTSVGVTERAITDLVGEFANIIAGNAQDTFGPTFMISVPKVILKDSSAVSTSSSVPMYVIPFFWNQHKAALVVGIE